MLKKAFLVLALVGSTSASNALVCPTKDVIQECEEKENCLNHDGKAERKTFSRHQMYAPMVEGASDTGYGITIVDKDDWGNQEMLKNYGPMMKKLFEDYKKTTSFKSARGSYNKYGDFDYKGIFKIGYRYNATECRRQIILGRHLRDKSKKSKGMYNGFTAIEICNPSIAGLFKSAKAALGAGNMPTINEFLAFVDGLLAAKKIPAATASQIKRNLSMTPGQAKAVMYFTDEDGDILPRFAVKISTFRWEKYGSNCEMIIDHKDEAADYAGLMSSYTDDYSWSMSLDPETPSDLNLWYWDMSVYKPGATAGVEYNYVEVKK